MIKSAASKMWRLDAKRTAFFLCDIQDKFRPGMPLFDGLVKNAKTLVAAAKILELPLIVTEHYPEKLGNIVKDLDISHACAVIPKTRFSMIVPELEAKLKDIFGDQPPRDVVLFGLECHICVEQTAMDLLGKKVNVHIVADSCCSRSTQDRDIALLRLSQAGCSLTTTESVLYNLMQDKKHPKFDAMRHLFKEPSADMQCKL